MNGKPVYKLMDGKGRVLIPKEMRAATGMDYGDIVRLGMANGKVCVRRWISSRLVTNRRRLWKLTFVRHLKVCQIIPD